MKTKVMFDGNIFDKILDNQIDLELITKKYELYITAIQREEIQNIRDDNKERREQLLALVSKLGTTSLPTPFTWDYVNFSSFSFSSAPEYWEVLKESKKNRNDALIAATAIHEGCLLVTEDREIIKKMKKLNKPVYTFDEFVSML